MGSKKRELIGKKFGKLTVISDTGKRGSGAKRIYLCRCECGNEKEVLGTNLTKKINPTTTCGCYKQERMSNLNKIDLKGKTFGFMTAIERVPSSGNKKTKWLCKCECGNVSTHRTNQLTKGLITDCGCKKRVDLSGKVFGKLTVLKEIRSIRYPDGNITRMFACKCDCGEESMVSYSRLVSGNTVSCGCYRIKIMSGKNNFRYNPNLTKEDREMRRYRLNDPVSNKWRNRVFERDNYTCVCCGYTKGNKFNAHHLDGWNWCKDKRFDLDNGATLCVECHKNFHSVYGYGNNTKEQFEEYLTLLPVNH